MKPSRNSPNILETIVLFSIIKPEEQAKIFIQATKADTLTTKDLASGAVMLVMLDKPVLAALLGQRCEKEKYKDILKGSMTYIENRGFETPKSYLKKGSDISITSDIVAVKEGKKYFFNIILKSEKLKLLKSK